MARQTDASIRAIAFNAAESAARRRSRVSSVDSGLSGTQDDVPKLTKLVHPRRRSSQASDAASEDTTSSATMRELATMLNVAGMRHDTVVAPSPVVDGPTPIPTPPVTVQNHGSFVRRPLPPPPVYRENLPISSPRARRAHTPSIIANAPSVTPVFSPRSPGSRREVSGSHLTACIRESSPYPLRFVRLL
jgi:hypothetical protein